MIAPQPLENALKASKYIANAVVVGERRNFIGALLVPNFESLARYCQEEGLGALPLPEQLVHPKVQALYGKEVARCTEGRARFEQIRAFRLLARDFSLDEGELTPTLKIRRNVVEKRHHELIQSIYPDAAAG